MVGLMSKGIMGHNSKCLLRFSNLYVKQTERKFRWFSVGRFDNIKELKDQMTCHKFK
jgi:hypothetical protein